MGATLAQSGLMLMSMALALLLWGTSAVAPRKLVVGGHAHWAFGINYAAWACKKAPIYQFDTLVFKYPLPNLPAKVFPHNVYLLPDHESYLKCDFSRAMLVANDTAGTGKGFEFVLEEPVPHYFACSVRNGFHCINGTMKFMVTPWLPYWE